MNTDVFARIVLGAIPIIVVSLAVGTIVSLVRESDWYKKWRGLCWRFGCHKKVTACRSTWGAGRVGPMCPEHCAAADHHAYFYGCNTPDGVPVRTKDLAKLSATLSDLERAIIARPLKPRKKPHLRLLN